ncbi:hypothetical protein [Brevibacillus sp. HD3.3A]|uniref:hypothetical protein n=1 Tax=Brevibacillus sp. HD3.3A TaxID=2738979 RepID=UPI00156B9263|nr:hypothetical protein [Brevibacillus sp. HD3.3A]UED70676.1 hypothetical protein HP435_08595 [Brevibacillus sp. HD3.3A]
MFDAKSYLKDRGHTPLVIERASRQAELFFANLEKATGRALTELEKRKLALLATDDWETVGVFNNLFAELAARSEGKYASL